MLKCHKKGLHSWQFWHVFWTYFFCYSRYLKDFLQLQTSNHYRSFELFRSNKIIKMSKLDSYSSMSLFLTALYTSLLKQSAFLHKNNVIYMAASVSRKCNILCIKFPQTKWQVRDTGSIKGTSSILLVFLKEDYFCIWAALKKMVPTAITV